MTQGTVAKSALNLETSHICYATDPRGQPRGIFGRYELHSGGFRLGGA